MNYLGTEHLLAFGIGFLLVGAALTAFGKDWRRTGYIAFVFAAAASAVLWLLAARVFASGTIKISPLLSITSLGASLTFRVDRLSAIFLLVVPFVALAATLYAVEYMSKVHRTQSPRMYYPFVLLLMTAIVGVVTSYDLFFFFIFWELMTLMSWVLVWFDREDEKKVNAAWTYFVVTHVAAACILVAALVAYRTSHSFGFAEIARGIGEIARTNPALVHVLMALFLIGFVTKAGMFPFGGWLPSAYPAAPSPASATFAGSMTKLGIYGVVRVAFEMFGTLSLTTVWGAIIATLGGVSIFVGTLTALREDDTKRVLSFHIIGQIGYMLLAIGTSLFFLRSNPVLASLALVAGLYHVVNHACYKSLLFLNVGAAEYWTGRRNLNTLGGLGVYMPVTLATCIVASLSIAGIPPLSGFNSKWLIYQSALNGGIHAPLFLFLGLIAMFISLVTLASFMKLLGCVFLGKQPVYDEIPRGEVPMAMRIPQVALAFVCILLGVAPILPLILLHGAAQDILGRSFVPGFASLFGANASGISLKLGSVTAGVWNPAYMVVALAVCGLIAYGVSRLGHASVRGTETWYGGEEAKPDEVRYRAHGFCLPFKEVFSKVYPSLTLPRIRILQHVPRLIDLDGWLYTPLVNAGGRVTDLLTRTHSGIPQTYLLWQLVGIVAVIAALFALLK